MKQMLSVFLFLVCGAFAQVITPNCSYPYELTGAQSQPAQNNVLSACNAWSFTYSGTAPALVETSQDGSTWGTTGITVTAGALPTTSGFGVVRFSGYAPYLRVRSTGTQGQTVRGVLMGSLALQAAATATVPNWIFSDYTPINDPGSWTAFRSHANLVRTNLSGGVVAAKFGVGATGVPDEALCRSYSAASGSKVRITAMMGGDHWQDDGGAQQYAIFLRRSSDGRAMLIHMNNQGNIMRGQAAWCAGTVAQLCGGAYTTLNGGFSPIFGAGFGLNTPASLQITKNTAGGNWEFRWYGISGELQIQSSPITLPIATFGSDPDQACFYFYVPNGNYYPTFLLLGFDQGDT